jgi:hypothetical protein
MSRIFTDVDEIKLIEHIPTMMCVSNQLQKAMVTPTQMQLYSISKIIWSYISQRGRKIYGGHAVNMFLLNSPFPMDAPYKNSDDFNDIEFYTPEPHADLRDLCDLIKGDDHHNVQARDAIHPGTFTISVDFKRVCDVTYVPRDLYDAIPVKVYFHNLKAVDPWFAMIDHLRILCDPFTSHWKLDRILPRILAIQRVFPLEFDTAPRESKKATVDLSCLQTALELVKETCVVVGDYGVGSYCPDHKKGRHLDLVSTKFKEDCNLFANAFPNNKAIKRCQVMDMLGRSVRYQDLSFRPKLVVTLYDYTGRAIPCSGSVCSVTALNAPSTTYLLAHL